MFRESPLEAARELASAVKAALPHANFGPCSCAALMCDCHKIPQRVHEALARFERIDGAR